MRQANTLLTIDERGSEIATTSAFHLSPVGRLMANKNPVYNYFLSTSFDSNDVFDCADPLWFRCTPNYLELLVLERKVYNKYSILFRKLAFAKPSCDYVLQPPTLRGLDCNTLSHLGLAKVNIRKITLGLGKH